MRLGIVRGISYGLFKEPDRFVPEARALGAGLVRAYLYWGQVEPRPGEYDFHVVDTLLAQLDDDVEVWLTVCSSSPWATRRASDFLPPSPAKDIDQYRDFVRRLVAHCAGRITYWQCDNEPSNTELLWAGTAQEYLAQLTAFHAVVKAADPAATVVLGGCGYDVLSSPAGSEPRQFFAHLLKAGRDAFDVFDIHLYGDPASIPAYVDDVRTMMREHGARGLLEVFDQINRDLARSKPLRRLLQQEPRGGLRLLTSTGGVVQPRAVACVEQLIVDEVRCGRYDPPADPGTLAYAVVRLAEAFLYNDASSDIRGDYRRLREVQAALLGVPRESGRPATQLATSS